MHSHRRLILTVCACLVVVGISAAVRMEHELGSKTEKGIFAGIIDDDSPAMDATFLEPDLASTTKVVIPKIPGLTAKAYLVGDVETGKIYLEHNSKKALPVASMSKLVTAFVATDMMSATATIAIASSTLSAPPDSSNLLKDERYPLQELLRPLLLSSSNIAAEAISLSFGSRERFMEMMSSYAWEIGMPSSFFADPSGVSPLNAASARDLFELAKYLVRYRPDILAITRLPEMFMATTTEHGGHAVVSTHPFVRDPRFIGGKTGRTTEAGETMMTILDMAGHPTVFIVLGCTFGARENDTRLLIGEYQKRVSR